MKSTTDYLWPTTIVVMKTLASRLKEARTEKKATQEDLAELGKVSKQAVSKIERGETLEPALSTMEPIARFLGVTTRWLMEGRMPKYAADVTQDAGWSDIMGVSQAAALGAGAVPDEYAETHKLKFREESLRRKKLRAEDLAVLYGKGDSMAPTIEDGDAILFDQSDTKAKDGGLYVISYDGHLMAKRLIQLGGMWFIDSDNKHDPQWKRPVPVDETRDFVIHGRVKWLAGWVD